MKTQTLFITLLSLIFIGTSCIGPRGYDGIDGVDGSDGIANVNVAIYDVDASSWQGNSDGFYTTLDVPEITEDIYYAGGVLMYILKNEGTDYESFNQLPYTWVSNSSVEYMDYDAYLGSIDILLRWTDDGENSTEAPNGTYTFKVIIVEGTPLSALAKYVDISNPEAVLNHFENVTVF